MSEPAISAGCAEHFALRPIRYLGGNVNRHWLVLVEGTELVLRQYPPDYLDDIEYEHEVLRRVRQAGWPVPELVNDPLREDGSAWCLFTFLPGTPQNDAKTPEARRKRGRLLAELNESTRTLTDMGQRRGFGFADEIVSTPSLARALCNYERFFPDVGYLLRWHLDQAIEAFGAVDAASARPAVLHGDFAPWNLLFADDELTGVLDFEATHLNFRVSEFALAWRGYQDEVIEGYEEVTALTGVERALIAPAHWSWLFLGLERQIAAMTSGRSAPHRFEWQVKNLLRRSKFHRHLPEYPGPRR